LVPEQVLHHPSKLFQLFFWEGQDALLE